MRRVGSIASGGLRTSPRARSRSRRAGWSRVDPLDDARAAPAGRRGCGRSRIRVDAARAGVIRVSSQTRCRGIPRTVPVAGSPSWPRSAAPRGRLEPGGLEPLEAEAQGLVLAHGRRRSGCEVRQDGAGSLWAVTPDADRGPWVCAGSHLDTQPDGGAYDGALGVVCGARGGGRGARVGRRAPASAGGGRVRRRGGSALPHPYFASLARRPGELDIDAVLEVMGDAPAIYGVTRESLLASREQLDRVALLLRGARRAGPVADRPRAWRWAWPTCWRRGSAGGSSSRASRTTPARRRWPTAATRCVEAARFVLAVDEAARATAGRRRHGRPDGDQRPDRPTRSPATWPHARRARARVGDGRRHRRGAARPLPGRAQFTQESRNEGATFDAGLRAQLLYAAAEARGITGRRPTLLRRPRRRHPRRRTSRRRWSSCATRPAPATTPTESASDADCVAAAQVLTDAICVELAAD